MNNHKKILIIDDNREIREIIQAYLSSKKCQCFPLSDGQYGPQIFLNNNIDLVICDMIMPNCDGIEIIQRIKKEEPEAKIIGISGGGNHEYLSLAEKFGASSILYKPFTRQELFEKIDSIGFSFTTD
jgi:DNA-binding NtrC family response regulator